MKLITLFSGFGGYDIGATAAGAEHLLGIEYDGKIAQVANDNGLHTMTANILDVDPASMPRAFTGWRIVRLTPPALARLQSFPDWYRLPDNKTLACRGIGNAVPSLLAERIAGSLI